MAGNGSERDKVALWRDVSAGGAVAAAVFSLSYANGGFEPTTRAYAAIAAWWLIGVGAALGVASARTRLSRTAFAVPVLMALLAVWTLVSMAWAPDGERAFALFDQVSLYAAVLVVGVFLARSVPIAFLAGGVALALSAIAGVALISRLFPSSFGVAPGSEVLNILAVRLSFPVGYWNGLGIEVALAVPLLLAAMCSQQSRVLRAVAVLPFPIIFADMYLASSRGAFAAAGIAAVAFLLLTPRRWPALAAFVVGGGAGVVGVAALVHKKELVLGEASSLAVHEGHRAALLIGLSCIGGAVLWLAVSEAGGRLSTPRPLVGRITATVLAALAVVAVLAAHPVRLFDTFRSSPATSKSGLYVTQHLLSSSGSGRWQFWGSAVSEFRAHPLQGGGAGSWEFWWLQHGSLHVFTQFPHSLYLETMAELGVVGLLLLLAWLLLAVTGAIRSARALASSDVAALVATGIAFFVAAAYDWVWELSGIAIVGVGSLGVALGTLPSSRASAARRLGFLRPALALLAVAAVVPQVIVLANGSHLSASRAAFAAGDLGRAESEALAAKAVEPWAASPYVQLGLIAKSQKQYAEAHRWLELAIDRSRQDWALWFIASEIDTDRGRARAARTEMQIARALNPRGTVFQTSH